MKKGYVLKTVWIFFISLFLVYTGFVAASFCREKNSVAPMALVEKTVYLETPFGKSASAVRIEIEVMDDVSKENGHVLSVAFAGQNIPLKPVDPTGRRGSTFLRLPPGNYSLQWEVKSPGGFPSTNRIEKSVSVSANEIGIYLLIKGDQLFIQNENQ